MKKILILLFASSLVGFTYFAFVRKPAATRPVVNVILTTEREPVDVAAKAARFLEIDSLKLQELFKNEAYLDSIGYTPQTLQALFIPNTYEVYRNSSPREFVTRMVKECQKFWDANNRREKAAALGLTPVETYTLASIIEKESQQNSEWSRIAGLYLNRLRDSMLLQADPTVIFANRLFKSGRVLKAHLKIDSPYNTYKYAGLPPGPIAMSSTECIDAVLSAEDHEYIFMCARGDGSGLHNFAKTMAGHGQNIKTYQANLRARGLR